METFDWSAGPATAWRAAVELATRLECSGGLPHLEAPVRLDDGEVLHANVQANCWWYGATDVEYEQRQLLVFGSLGLLGLSAAASAAWNRRRRAEAEALAAPQWRLLGCAPVLATNERLLVQAEGTWTSVWLPDVLQFLPEPTDDWLELDSEGLPPLAIGGPWAPYLAVVLSYLLWSEVLALPTHTRPEVPGFP